MAHLINTYPPENEPTYAQLVDDSIAQLPYTLAHPLQQFYLTVGQENYAKAKDYLLEMFELAAQYLSVVLLASLRECLLTARNDSSSLDNKALQQITSVVGKIDQKRPLSFGDWCNDILPPLTAAASRLMPDTPLTSALVRRTSSKNNLFIGGKNETSIVFYRNQYKGHGTILADEKYRELLIDLEPRLMQLLEALAPLRGCTALWQDGHLWMEGSLGTNKIDLAPLVFIDSQEHEYIFQSLNDERAYYVSANEHAGALLTTDTNSAIDAFFQTFVPAFDIAKRRNWTEWCSLLQDATNRWLQSVYREKKYNRELFVERHLLTSQLRAFVSSDATLFPMPGEAGQGKTNQLCYWSETLASSTGSTLLDTPASALILSGSDLSGTTIEAYLKSLFDISARKNISRVLDEMHDAASDAGASLVLLIDALNECENYGGGNQQGEQAAAALLADIMQLFVQQRYPHFKVLFTCRNYTWKHHLQPLVAKLPDHLLYTAAEGEATTVRGFNDDELQRAYAIYSDVYSIQTDFGHLSRSMAIRLKDPLVLKIACTNYLGHSMPDSTRQLTSISLWSQLHDSLHSAYAGSRQMEIIDMLTDAILQSYLHGSPSNSIHTADLRQAIDQQQHPLHPLATLLFGRQGNGNEGGITVAFAELINRPERPVLRYDADDRVQFVYERFLEYMLALRIKQSLFANFQLEDNQLEKEIVALMERVSPDEVMLGAMRNLLIMHYCERGESTLLLNLIAHHSDNFLLMTLLTDVMNVLVRENYEQEIFAVERDLIRHQSPQGIESIYPEFNHLQHTIESGTTTGDTIDRFNTLHARLQPVLRLRTMAIQTLLGGLMLTDYFNEDLYHDDPMALLWMLTDDPLVEVKDAVCLQAYYISHQHLTLGGTPIRQNLSELIAQRMYDWLNQRSVLLQAAGSRSRRRMMTFLETATRLNVILIIDALLSQDAEQQKRVGPILDTIRATVRHLTLNGGLIRLALPVLGTVMRRQLTFQSDYVNNAIEYQHFWSDDIPLHTDHPDHWSRQDLQEVMKFIFLNSQYYAAGRADEAPDFAPYIDKFAAAYRTGDSLSYFVLERLLVICGVCSWPSLQPLMRRLDDGSLRQTPWWDYTQMSIIYVLYQLGMKMHTLPDEAFDMLGRWCVDWTRRLRGLFSAPYSDKANPRQRYKRNVMTWYAMVYAYRNGDRRREAYTSAPLFYQLIDEAVDQADGELLTHLVDNISELITDSGYIHTALDLLTHVMTRIDSEEKMQQMGIEETLPQQIALLLSTAKSYTPEAINSFLSSEVLHLPFPGGNNYRDEILNYTPCGEKLSDLMTHRFGNFVMFSLLYQYEIDAFCHEAASHLPSTRNFSEWLAIVVRMLVRDLFKIKVKV